MPPAAADDSVAPAGLGYKALTRESILFWKKKARLMGISKPSHSASVILKVCQEPHIARHTLVFRSRLGR